MSNKPFHLTNVMNDSMRNHAEALQMPHEVYLQFFIDRFNEVKGKKIPQTYRDPKLKRTVIKASNPVLVVGAGPSYLANIEAIKRFKGKVIIFDVNFNHLVEHGVIPDYALSLEKYVRPNFFDIRFSDQIRDKTKFVFSAISNKSMLLQCVAQRLEHERWVSDQEPRFSNVGTFGMCYAKMVLNADKIFLIGFEHDGVSEVPQTWEYWIADFWYFVKQWPKETIVNCTNGGRLYLEDYILDSTLDSLELDLSL